MVLSIFSMETELSAMAPMKTRSAAVMRLLASTSAISDSSRNSMRSTGLSGAALMSMYSRTSLTSDLLSAIGVAPHSFFKCPGFRHSSSRGGLFALGLGFAHGHDLVQ